MSDVRTAATLDDRGGRFQFYRSLAQWSFNSATIVLRSHYAPEAVAMDLRRVLAELDSDQAVYRIDTVRHEIETRLASIDAAARTLVGFALLGLLLAAVGIYGVIATRSCSAPMKLAFAWRSARRRATSSRSSWAEA